MLFEDLDKGEVISFVKANKIPLGINSYKGYSKDRIICLPYEKYSGAMGIVGESGTGKSVLLKRIYAYMLGYYQKQYAKRRIGVIFDMQSEDHRLSRFGNSKPAQLFWKQGEKPFGLEIKCYVPKFIAEERHPDDEIFGFDMSQFEFRDFLCLRMGMGSASILDNLIKQNPESTKDIHKFYEAIMTLPKSQTEYLKVAKKYLFKIEKSFNYSSISSLQDAFIPAYKDNVFSDKNDPYLNNKVVNRHLCNVIVVNFHQEVKYYPIYAGKILKDIYKLRRESYRREAKGQSMLFPPPVVIVEEADKLIPSAMLDRDFNSAAYWLLEILKRGRRYGIMTLLATQEASAMNTTIRDHTRMWCIGKCISNDYGFFSSFLGSDVINAIRYLDKSKHEFIVIYENKTFDSFYAFDSPLEINREVKFG